MNLLHVVHKQIILCFAQMFIFLTRKTRCFAAILNWHKHSEKKNKRTRNSVNLIFGADQSVLLFFFFALSYHVSWL